MINRKDDNVIHNLFKEFHYVDNIGVIKFKLAEYVATVRREEQRNLVNSVAAVLDANEVEAFRALIMKAKASPDLNSETRSVLKSEAEIRREGRDAVLKEMVAKAETENPPHNSGNEYARGFARAKKTILGQIKAAIAESRKGEG